MNSDPCCGVPVQCLRADDECRHREAHHADRGLHHPMTGAAEPPPNSPLATQVGGSHYKDLKIQPVEYIHANNIPFIEGNVIKYVTRWRAKNGIKDLEKARHFIDLLIELENAKG
jgi:hypothetical protein